MINELETALFDRIAAQEERIRQLEELLVPSKIRIPLEWSLSPAEATVFACLAARRFATKEMIYHALYALRSDDVEPKIVDVFICKLRKKVKPFGVIVETVWGSGYTLVDREKYAEVEQ
nr:helix-turn-helix domain-containing protein [Brucella anthropi]DAM62818.1 MAG TPA: Transcriptional regulatory protein, C terminal [Caudoviricetes sp.]